MHDIEPLSVKRFSLLLVLLYVVFVEFSSGKYLNCLAQCQTKKDCRQCHLRLPLRFGKRNDDKIRVPMRFGKRGNLVTEEHPDDVNSLYLIQDKASDETLAVDNINDPGIKRKLELLREEAQLLSKLLGSFMEDLLDAEEEWKNK
ncbi:uncharacterized protein LOC143226331 isoform X2 [Tachypleus tridentatus]